MERVCFTFQLKPGSVQEYRRRHDHMPAELTELMGRAGISDYSIFARGDVLYAFLKAEPDFASVQRVLAGSDVQQRWEAHMEDLILWQKDADGRYAVAREVARYEGPEP